MKEYRDRKYLYHNYVVLGKSTRKIAKECGAGKSTIWKWIKKYNIPRRTISEAMAGEKNPMYGKKQSKEHRQRISAIMCRAALRGLDHPFYGKKFSDEHRQKLSESHTGERNPFYGKSHTEETRHKMAIQKRGQKHWNWRGGISSKAYGPEFGNILRSQIRERDGFICQECHQVEEQLRYPLSVHHIDYDKENNSPENLISLCKSCHSQTNFGREDWIEYFRNKTEEKICH